ncbi:hypothetical protein AB0C93_05275 [Streptomyces sp. NPDC048518]|uniref:hypothetical protein n=1 Tax=Streptomyces sp. NPDC048518 TaxID=3155029 RepID=UPI0033DE2A1A
MRDDVLQFSVLARSKVAADTLGASVRPPAAIRSPARPVRFRGDDGKWTPVDIGLAKLADGRVGPKAHPLGLTLAGATPEREDAAASRRLRAAEAVPAATPLVSLTTEKGQRVELGWRGALPAPRIDGTKATYRDALPHADLVVDTTRTGFEQSVVLNSPEAGAANLRQHLKNRRGAARSPVTTSVLVT